MHTEVMKAIQIRNVPEPVHAILQRRAEAAGQSMQEYLLLLVSEHAGAPTLAEWLEEAGSDSGGRLPPGGSAAWIREDRDSR